MLVVTLGILEKMTRRQLIDFSWKLVCEMAEIQSESLDHQDIVDQMNGVCPPEKKDN